MRHQTVPISERIPVLIVEDDDVLRRALSALIESQPGLVVQTRATTVAEAVAALRLGPGMIILDWTLRDGTALEVLRAMWSWSPAARALVFAANLAEPAIRQALAAGASGYLEKSAGLLEITKALRRVAAGEIYLGPRVQQVIGVGASGSTSARPELTLRESEVLRLVGQGRASKQIAAQLGLSVRTVENHRAAIMRKTGLRSAAQLAVHSVRLGLVAVEAS